MQQRKDRARRQLHRRTFPDSDTLNVITAGTARITASPHGPVVVEACVRRAIGVVNFDMETDGPRRTGQIRNGGRAFWRRRGVPRTDRLVDCSVIQVSRLLTAWFPGRQSLVDPP